MADSGYKDVDYGLTTRELAKMFSEAGIDLPNLPKSDFDDPFGTTTGSGVIFGATGGVMEAALRTVIELVCGIRVEDLYQHANITPVRGFEGVRYVEIPIKQVGPVPGMLAHLFADWSWLAGATLKVGVSHGTANARKVLEDIKAGGPFSQCHFIEFMACTGGCIGGGGQPIPTSPETRGAEPRHVLPRRDRRRVQLRSRVQRDEQQHDGHADRADGAVSRQRRLQTASRAHQAGGAHQALPAFFA